MSLKRSAEIIIPVITWSIITFPVWMSPFNPVIVSYFILGFDLYFFYKALTMAYFSALSYKRILFAQKQPFFKWLEKNKTAAELIHLIVIPNYKEPIEILRKTLKSIVDSDYPYKKNIYAVLAFEEREEEAKNKFRQLKKEFSGRLNMISTYHILSPGEVVGKASNQSWAVREAEKILKDKLKDPSKVLITISDADSILSKNYLSYLSYKFLSDNDRYFHFYWAPLLLYNNFHQLPFFVRLQATISSILRLAFLSQSDKLIQISTYSVSLDLLRRIGYWDTDIIPEDWHVFFQAFLKYGSKVKTIPLYTLLSGDAVYSGSFIKTFINRYEQEKRWAWGVTDVVYLIANFRRSSVDSLTKIKKILFVAEHHLLWPTTFFIVTIAASIPPLINPHFANTTLGFYLPKLSAFILTLSTALLVVYIYLDFKLRHRLKKKTDLRKIPFYIIQWYTLPVISFLLSALPALEAHTRLFLNKKIEYKVTEKI